MDIVEAIQAYSPVNQQEAADKAFILARLKEDRNAFDRSAPAHVTCSAWAVDAARTQTLMVYHNIYDSWSWIGGHADGERDLPTVALRELAEETGVHGQLVPYGVGDIFSLEVLTVDGHVKHGAYVSSHLHLNITYLVQADVAEPLRVAPDENSGVRWVPLDQVESLSDEPWIRERIYRKLIAKTHCS